MSRDELTGWYNVASLSGKCVYCKYKLVEGRSMASCEYGQPWFPHAVKCVRYEPEDLDE